MEYNKKQQLYIIRCGNTNKFKIGVSKDPLKRCRQLQTGNPEILKIYFVFHINDSYKNIDAFKLEHIIHQFLKEQKNKHIINEWFELNEDIVFNIVKCLTKNFE